MLTRWRPSLFLSLLLCLSTVSLRAATRTVCASGCDHTTISACAAVAVAGDICEIQTGSYAGWTQSTNGSSGSPITFRALAGNTVTITSTVTLTSRSYITLGGAAANQGLRFVFTSGSGISATSGASFIVIQNNYFENRGGSCVRFGTGESTDIQILNNTGVLCGHPVSPSDLSASIFATGQRFLISGNDLSQSGDCIYIQGTSPVRSVIRNNTCHDMNVDGTAEHIDGIQLDGAVGTLDETLIENNVFKTCVDAVGGDDCHTALFQTDPWPDAVGIIGRYNYSYSWGPIGLGSPDFGDDVTHSKWYHNTVASGKLGGNGSCVLIFQVADFFSWLNNICYNTTTGSSSNSPTQPSGTVGNVLWNATVVFTTGYSGTWGSPFNTEATYTTWRNVNPQFANYPTVAALASDSTLINGGVHLTTVDPTDTSSGTSLVVADTYFFQANPGGFSAVQKDQICVGTTVAGAACVQISSITHGTPGTLVLASAITRADNDKVWLYKDSDGTIVLNGSAPDIGAVEFDAGAPVITTNPTLPAATVGVAITGNTIVGTCSNTPCTWTSDITDSGACTGITFTHTSSTVATMGGTPTTAGTCGPFNVTLTDNLSQADTEAFTLPVNAAATGGSFAGRLRGVIR